MYFETTEQYIKNAIWQKMNKEALEEMQNKKKVSDRLTENAEDNSYIHTLSLPETRIWIRYRGRAINGVKGNFKNSHTDDMKCRFCPRVPKDTVEDHVENEINPEQNQNYPEETQEHLEICKGTNHERRRLNISKWQGIQKSG